VVGRAWRWCSVGAVSTRAAPDDALDELVAGTSEQLRAPRAASIAGLAFAVLFTAAVFLLRSAPVYELGDAAIAKWFADGGDRQLIVGGLYLGPFACVALLWFIAVVRDQIGDREDRFFATLFFGSGVLLVALLFATMAVVSSLVVGYAYLDQPPPTASAVADARALAYTLMFAFATRAGALFMISTTTAGVRASVFPRWLALLGYVFGLLLLLVVTFFDWVVLVLPVWVAIVSVVILRREWGRAGQAPRAVPG
jgi:hypothetical protein